MIFILIFLLGIALLAAISRDFNGRELLALGMPIGLGTTSFIMFILDRTIHSITATNVMISVFILAAICGALRLYSDKKHNDLPWKRKFKRPDMSWLTLVWLVFAGVISYLAYGITMKCLYWPPAEFDTILGYDLLSKAIAHEHIIANSLLTNRDVVNGCGPRMMYPPLLALSNSLCYMTGMETPKLINSFFFLSWIPIVYLLLRRFVSSTGAILFTFLTIIIPEMFQHASFSLTNLPCAIYTSIAVMSFVIWYEQRKEGFFYLSFIAVIFGIWTRSEAVLFAGGIMAVLLYVLVRERKFKYILIYATSIIPFLIWNAFLKAYVPRDPANIFISKPFYDAAKMKQVLATAWAILGSYDYYGITFYLAIVGFIIIMVLNIGVNFSKKKNKVLLGALILWFLIYFVAGPHIITLVLFAILMIAVTYLNDDRWEFVFIFFFAFGIYSLMFYQMKEDGTLFSSGGWMQSGYKRGLFCYAPLGLFMFVTSKWVSYAFGVLDEKMALFKKPAA